jgi:hypothetical protein
LAWPASGPRDSSVGVLSSTVNHHENKQDDPMWSRIAPKDSGVRSREIGNLECRQRLDVLSDVQHGPLQSKHLSGFSQNTPSP